MTSAEARYFFRHELFRDGAYGLQLPSVRGQLHLHALELLEPALQDDAGGVLHAELAHHARQAQAGADDSVLPSLRDKEIRYGFTAAERMWNRGDEHSALGWYRHVADAGHASAELRLNSLLRVIAVLRLRDNIPGARESVHAAQALAGDAGAVLRARLLLEVGSIEAAVGAYAASFKCYFAALEIFDRANDHKHSGVVLGDMAANFLEQGNFEKAREFYARALSTALQAGVVFNVVTARSGLAMTLKSMGDFDGANREFSAALAEASQAGIKRLMATVLSYLAGIDQAQGRMDDAMRNLRACIKLARDAVAWRAEIAALASLGLICLERGEIGEAEESFRRGRELALEAGLNTRAAGQLCNLACAQARRGATDDAVATFQQAIAEQLKASNPAGAGNASADLGWTLFEAGRLAEARTALADAERRLEGSGRVLVHGAALCMAGLCALLLGDTAGARARLAQAGKSLTPDNSPALHLQLYRQLALRLLVADNEPLLVVGAQLDAMRDSFVQLGADAASDAGRAMAECAALVHACGRGGPARVFRGYLVERLPQAARTELAAAITG